jgi:hypothetical protein
MKEFRKGITYLVVLENNFYNGSDSVDGALMCGRRYLSMSGSNVIKDCIGITILRVAIATWRAKGLWVEPVWSFKFRPSCFGNSFV